MSSDQELRSQEPGLLPVATMVLWCGCLAVGIAGALAARDRVKPAAPPAPVETELLTVETVNQPVLVPPNAKASPQAAASPPALPEVALPNPTIAFEQPVNQPAHAPAAPKRAPVIHLTFGEGEGDQPPPEEPPEAVRDGEEGTVVIRMTVGEDGRVQDAEAVSPSRWPMLNNAALRAIRSTWRFRKGPVRVYEVSIEFDINRHE